MTFPRANIFPAGVKPGKVAWNHSGRFARTSYVGTVRTYVDTPTPCTVGGLRTNAQMLCAAGTPRVLGNYRVNLVAQPIYGPSLALQKRISNLHQNRDRFSKNALKEKLAGVRKARLAKSER